MALRHLLLILRRLLLSDKITDCGHHSTFHFYYWFWTEFIAETITFHIDPDVDIDWKNYNHYSIRKLLRAMINDAFEYYEEYIDQYALAHYYANILANKSIVAYIKATKDGALLIHTPGRESTNIKESYVTFAEEGIDPTCRSDVSSDYYPVLDELQEFLEKQLSLEHYWETNLESVTYIGQSISTLRNIKISKMPPEQLNNLMKQILSN